MRTLKAFLTRISYPFRLAPHVSLDVVESFDPCCACIVSSHALALILFTDPSKLQWRFTRAQREDDRVVRD